jgi:hypothetical protein
MYFGSLKDPASGGNVVQREKFHQPADRDAKAGSSDHLDIGSLQSKDMGMVRQDCEIILSCVTEGRSWTRLPSGLQPSE